METMSLAGLVLILTLLSGCARHAVQTVPPGAPLPARTYVDLEPGWRLTLITPMRRASARDNWRYGPPSITTVSSDENRTVTVRLDPNIEFGYERTQYQVLPSGLRWQKSIRIIEGKEEASPVPLLDFLPRPEGKRHARLLFLTRASDQNYNTAVLLAPNAGEMENLTREVRAHPEQGCRLTRQTACVWIPPGVAARPEKPSAGGFVPAL